MTEKAFFIAGKFGAAQGIKGWVRVISYMEYEEDIFDGGPWFIPTKALKNALPDFEGQSVQGFDEDDTSSVPATLSLTAIRPDNRRFHPKGFMVSLPSLSDRDKAALLTNQFIYLPLDALKDLDGGDLYWRDLIGLKVFDLNGEARGEIVEMLETGANDVMVVVSEQKQRTLVPYIPEQVIKALDKNARTITLDWDFSALS